MNLGYACLCETLRKDGIFTSRSMRLKTFNERGIDYVSDLALQNVKDLLTIIKWNNDNDIKLYRMSSQIFPWVTMYKMQDLKDYGEICEIMLECGATAINAGQRLTMHPGPYNCLASPNPKVVEKTIKELHAHSEQMDMLGYAPSHYNKINIHIGGSYGDKEATLKRFCENFYKLNINTRSRLVVENDDKPNEFSVRELYDSVYKRIGTPITFDYFHHTFNTGGLSEEDALWLAATTWPDDVVQCCHYSESRQKEKLDETIRKTAHSDLIYNRIQTYGLNPDIVIEAKLKELSIFSHRKIVKELNSQK